MRFVVAAVGMLGACTPIYDAQYDDRAGELEQSRTEFLAASERVKWITVSTSKFYWESLDGPLAVPLFHSYDPSTDQRVDYEFSRGETKIADSYHVSDDLVVKCSFGTSTAYDATMSNVKLGTTTLGEETCAIEGGAAYFSVGREIRKWIPANGDPVKVLDIDLALGPTANQLDGFAVSGTQAVLAEGSRLWLANVAAGTAVYLDNTDGVTSGSIAFDARGVMFSSQKGVEYLAFDNHGTLNIANAIADGGYSVNFKHGDVQTLAEGGGYTLQANHAIYRGIGGIFAYGFDSQKVIDLLLDRGTGYMAIPSYGDPQVTADGTLFVQDKSMATSDAPHPVYRVDLNGRLR